MYNFDLGRPASVYFCGIGGVSMSGLALILKSRGFRVSGSDRAKSAVTENLEAQGIRVFYGQKKENIAAVAPVDVVVYTAAVHPDNPEFMAANEAVEWLTKLFGTGQGSGAALMMFILGSAGTILCLASGKRLERYRFTEE